jgi:hypothetical protein
MRRSRPSPAMLVACAALFAVLGGTAVAASRYVITNTDQIKPSVLSALGRGAPGYEVDIEGSEISVRPGQVIGLATATCPGAGAFANSPTTTSAAYHLVSGGYFADLAPGGFVMQSKPSGSDAWIVLVNNERGTDVSHVRASVLCAPGRVQLAAGSLP